jgi:hypothetical protein
MAKTKVNNPGLIKVIICLENAGVPWRTVTKLLFEKKELISDIQRIILRFRD